MLEGILRSHTEPLTALATAWLAGGATSYELWGEKCLAQWPEGGISGAPEIEAPIVAGGSVVGKLRVAGATGADATLRLGAEATLIGSLVSIEQELDTMTVELIDMQDQLLALYELTQSTRNHLRINDTLASLARDAARLVRSESACAILAQEQTLLVVQHPPAAVAPGLPAQLFGRLQGGATVLLLGAGNSELPEGPRNLCFVPIQVRGQAIAALGLFNKHGGDFASPDLKLIRTIAEQAGARIETILLYQENLEQAKLGTEMDLAAGIQLRLLPRTTPVVKGLDMYARSRPALQVGGDFFEFIYSPERPVTFAVGDVAGKGMSAALLMSITHTVLRNAARFMPTPLPAAIISRANTDLYDDLTEVGMFVTTFVGQYDSTTREMRYANAGHSPVIFCNAGGAARMLTADGAPLGVLDISFCENQVVPFNAGDVIVVATDGFSEARNTEDELYGYDRLLTLVEQLADRTAQEIAGEIYDAISRWSAGGIQDDDQTLVVVKACPASATEHSL